MRAAHVGLIGCGRWGQFIVRDLKALGALVTVVARSADSRGRAEQQHADAIVSDIGALRDVQAVYIASLISTHAEVIDAVLGLGVPIFCEKPLTSDAAWAERTLARGVTNVWVLDKWRYHPGIREIARVARSGELGPIVGLATDRLGWGSTHDDSTATWVLGPHDLAIGLEVLGLVLPLRSVTADAAGGQLSGWSAKLGDAAIWQTIEISERSPERLRRVRLFCRDGGVALANPFADHVLVWRFRVGAKAPAGEPERLGISTEWPLKLMLAETLRHLDGGPPLRTSFAEAVTIVKRLAEIEAACADRR